MEKTSIPLKKSDVGRFMVGVGAVIEHPMEQDKILLLHRHADNSFNANEWELVFGRLNQGESFEDGLRREIWEETGMANCRIYEIVSTFHFYRGQETQENEIVGIVNRVQAQISAIALSTEHDRFEWVTPKQALERVQVPGIREHIKKYIDLTQI